MGVILEIRNGGLAGKTIALRIGQSVTVGRAGGQAQFTVEQDGNMSRVHFAVECTAQGSRVADRGSSNGTYLNGRKIRDAAQLATGDEIRAGQTVFAVKFISDEKLAAMGLASPAAAPSEQRPQPAKSSEGSVEPASPIRQEPVPPLAVSRHESDAGLRGRVDPDSVRPLATPPRRLEEPPQPPPRIPDSREREAPVPQVEERPKFHAIPNPERSIPAAQRIVEPPAPEPAANISAPPRPQPRPEPVVREAARAGRPRAGGEFRVMGWSFPAAPAQWQVQEGFGLQQNGGAEFPASVAVTEENLGEITLQQYVEAQIGTLRGYFRDARIEPAMAPKVVGAEECIAVDVRHATKDGKELVHRWIYARSGLSVGMLTVTALAAELPTVLDSLRPLLDGAAFQATVNA